MFLKECDLFFYCSKGLAEPYPSEKYGHKTKPSWRCIMWNNIRNISNAVANIVAIGSKEVAYQAGRASTATEGVTSTLSSKAATLRAKYEADLADRKSGIKKPTVVPKSEVPKEAVAIN